MACGSPAPPRAASPQRAPAARSVLPPGAEQMAREIAPWPPGLEREILRRLPKVALVGTLLPLCLSLFARLVIDDGSAAEISKQVRSVDIFSIASLVTIWTGILTVAIGCVVVFIMKGPAYAADSYEVSHADRPRKRTR